MTWFGIPLGLRYMAEAALYFSIMSALVKLAGERGVPWEQIVFARSLFAVTVTFGWLRMLRIEPWGDRRGWLVARGLVGVGGLTCFYYAVTHLPLGDATVIQYTNPAFVAVFAVFLVGERLRAADLLAVVLCLVGVTFIARPTFIFGGAERLPLTAVGIGLGGALFSALAYTIVRRLGRTEHPLVTVLYFPLVATPVTAPLAFAAGYVPDPGDLAALVGVGLASQLAQVRLTQGLKLERAGRATAVTYLQIVFAFGWGLLLFDEVPTAWTLLGTLIVVGTTVGIARRAARSPSTEEVDVEGEDAGGPVDDLDGTQR
jgi:drug/metabolite transporter (DMT)-like permease